MSENGTRAWAAAELSARASYGRLVAFLARRCGGDIAAAEDALSEAFASALANWPQQGAPDNPDAWLLSAARRKLIDAARRNSVRNAAADHIALLAEEHAERATLPDERLSLLLACAHPAIEPDIRTPLMLQVVLGVAVERVAGAFLASPAAMAKRLVRAKAKIKAAGVALDLSEPTLNAERIDAVLDAIYAAYGAGWDDASGADPRAAGLAEEALFLGRLMAQLAPDHAEAQSLLSLMAHCEARRPARRDEAGRYVPVAAQNIAQWSRPLIMEAERALAAAAALPGLGRYRLEAILQSLHASRAIRGATPWVEIANIYAILMQIAPSAGALVGQAAALGEARGAAQGLAALEGAADALKSYQPYWAVRAHLLAEMGDAAGADQAYARAAALSEDPAVRAFLLDRASARAHKKL